MNNLDTFLPDKNKEIISIWQSNRISGYKSFPLPEKNFYVSYK